MMNTTTGKYSVDAAAVLSGLKDFQRATVDYAFERLYGSDDPARRFLVADEVGLGKTLIARGVIARAIEHLRDTVRRIDVVYVCSNADIARQNIDRLRVTDEADGFTLASRMTLLPLQVRNLDARDLNFIALTPGTSFDIRESLGRVEERVLLHSLISDAWDLSGAAPMNVLRGHVAAEQFRKRVRAFDSEQIDPSARTRFFETLQNDENEARRGGERSLRGRFEDLCRVFVRADSPTEAYAKERARVVGRLRARLAASCIEALEPDLIILDEFQRFKHLFEGDDDSSQLARELFRVRGARLLLLSATPYRMFTAAGEEGSHYDDFLSTIRFLEGDQPPIDPLEATLEAYRGAVYDIASPRGLEALDSAARALGNRLSRVMTRTERLGASSDRNGMLRTHEPRALEVAASDVRTFGALHRVGQLLGETDVVELWKSAPYLLSFLDDYALKRAFSKALDDASKNKQLRDVLLETPGLLLPWREIERYGTLDPGNARLRALRELTLGEEAWRLCWVPSSLPSYAPAGAYARPELLTFTKQLVFSAWRVVPRVIASLLSHEAEGAMLREDPQAVLDATPEGRRQHRQLLRFNLEDGRPTQMTAMTLVYPSTTLARLGDPLAIVRAIRAQGGVRLPSQAEVLDHVRAGIERALAPILQRARSSGPTDDRWYWAAAVLLDLELEHADTRDWLDEGDLAGFWAGQLNHGDRPDDEHAGWSAHVDVVAGVPGTVDDLGPPPTDLADVLALVALASPAVVTLRAFQRVLAWPSGSDEKSSTARDWARTAAGAVAWAFRSLWNVPEVMTLLRGSKDARREPYWQIVLHHCADGVLDSVMTEYAHVLVDSLGAGRLAFADAAVKLAEEMASALTLRTSSVAVDDVHVGPRSVRSGTLRRLRARFAVRFGDERQDDDEGGGRTRASQVRTAFNSPFAPFVLATTSVGQEGLDFHTYCHSVVHWNLPSNPVDLEQREGRVHRFKGHAVRRNVASRHGYTALIADDRDPWRAAFAAARAEAVDADSEIVPYWVYPIDGGETVRRIVLALPHSRDARQSERLRRSLAVYRMVFGQPRQDDLVEYLLRCVPPERLDEVLTRVRVEVGVARPRSG